ncbi:dsDNA nuclease domain-containing protein [Polaromonas sp. UC242_47]|uniref:dsDNA nuclease domain-containing protein n=1 Tax=Polaromonas sp. UC242_47 TaxID=3374626 RepID=UPI0037BD7722
MKRLNEVPVREANGRDTILRYRLQCIAAAYASLQILDGKDIDRVYCDFHDDFVVRHKSGTEFRYHFHQVKTNVKQKHQWSLGETVGINKKKLKAPEKEDFQKIRSSFFGKLLSHAINFDAACKEMTLLTNVHFHDDTEKLISDIRNDTSEPLANFLREQFQRIFQLNDVIDIDTAKKHLKKLVIAPNTTYISIEKNDFEGLALTAIYKYSEIELSYREMAEISQDLISLAHQKSFSRLMTEVSAAELDQQAGIGIDDLLRVLSISKSAYKILMNGGDGKALRSASVIQRTLHQAGATTDLIDFCTQQKVRWDIWVREKRHFVSELDFNILQSDLMTLRRDWNGLNWSWLREQLTTLQKKLEVSGFNEVVTVDLLIGGFFAALVRSDAQ